MRTIGDDPEVQEHERRQRSEEDFEPVVVGHYRCDRETTRAILVTNSENELDEFWLPKSTVHDDSEVYSAGDEGKLIVVRWMAEKKGWA